MLNLKPFELIVLALCLIVLIVLLVTPSLISSFKKQYQTERNYKTDINSVDHLINNYLLEYFTIIACDKKERNMTLYCEEKEIPPKTEASDLMLPKGFLPEITVLNLQLPELNISLYLRRRKWYNQQSKTEIIRELNIEIKESRLI